MACFAIGKKSFVWRGLLDEIAEEAFVNFVAFLGNAWANGAAYAANICAKFLHRTDGVLKHAAYRAFPASMRRADDTGLNVRKQDRDTIGGHNAQKDVRLVRHHGVAAWWVIFGYVVSDLNNIGRMELVDASKSCAGQDGLHAK